MTTRAPETLEPADIWRRDAACARPGNDPELWFPHRSDRQSEQAAKSICGACPVRIDCLEDTLTHEGNTLRTNRYGIRGGLTGGQRRYFYDRLIQRGETLEQAMAAARDQPPTLPPAATAQEAIERRSTPIANGHRTWSGSESVAFRGVKYTAVQLAFLAGHGRRPDGPARRICGHPGCVTPEHLTDRQIRKQARQEATTAATAA